MLNTDYDDGYSVCPCFWGVQPAEMVVEALALVGDGRGGRALDLGCGEGKNAIALAHAGFQVVAIDRSHLAINNAIKAFDGNGVNWLVANLLDIIGPYRNFDIILATGSFHCLHSEMEISQAVKNMQDMTKVGGVNVLYAFNDGPHDFGGHPEGFRPTLLSHESYTGFYEEWEIIRSSDMTQGDLHPNNGIRHSHSITRVLARKLS